MDTLTAPTSTRSKRRSPGSRPCCARPGSAPYAAGGTSSAGSSTSSSQTSGQSLQLLRICPRLIEKPSSRLSTPLGVSRLCRFLVMERSLFIPIAHKSAKLGLGCKRFVQSLQLAIEAVGIICHRAGPNEPHVNHGTFTIINLMRD